MLKAEALFDSAEVPQDVFLDKTDPCLFCVLPHMGSNAQGMVPKKSDDEPLCHFAIPQYEYSDERNPSLCLERFDS